MLERCRPVKLTLILLFTVFVLSNLLYDGLLREGKSGLSRGFISISRYPGDEADAGLDGGRSDEGGWGGSYYDDFNDEDGLEICENCTVDSGHIRLHGLYPDASWLYDGWNSRKEVIIVNPSSDALVEYEVRLDVTFITGMQADFDDLRFSFYDVHTELESAVSHWIESRNDGDNAVVWVKVPDIPALGECSILMYYGNPLAADGSDGESTFLFFDDFSGMTLDVEKWIEPVESDLSTYSISGGNLELYVHNVWTGSTTCTIRDPMDLEKVMVEQKQRSMTGGTPSGTGRKAGIQGMGFYDKDLVDFRFYGRGTTDNKWLKYSTSYDADDVMWGLPGWDGSDPGYHVLGYGWNLTTISLYEDMAEVTRLDDAGIDTTGVHPNINNVVSGYGGDGWGTMWVDWFRIRHHAYPEPTFYLRGETGSVLSAPVHLPQGMIWDTAAIQTEEPEGTSVTWSLVNSDTRIPIPGYDEIVGTDADLSGLNGMGVGTVCLLANISGCGHATPRMTGWGLEWSDENAWRDVFIGGGRIDLAENVKISGMIRLDGTTGNGSVSSSVIPLRENMIWSGLSAVRRVPNGAYLNVSIVDADTLEVLTSDHGRADDIEMELTPISPTAHSSIRLEAEFSSESGSSPILEYWGISFSRDPLPPKAMAGDDRDVHQKERVLLNASRSFDNVGITNYTWRFQYLDGLVTLKGREASFVFDHSGEYTIYLNVSDEAGNWDADTLRINVLDTTPPRADAGRDIGLNQLGTAEFDASKSSDNVGIVDYWWTFHDGDDAINLSGKAASHTFHDPGIYEVVLTVMDDLGNLDRDIMLVSVRDITPPLAAAGPDLTAKTGEPVTLSANASHDESGIGNCTWLFFYNRSVMVLRGEEPSFSFELPGSYVITLIVTDLEGNSAEDNLTVTVSEDGNEDGAAEDSDGDGYNNTHENASGSDPFDPASTPVDLDGDGVVNEKDAYPLDPTRWAEEKAVGILTILLFVGFGAMAAMAAAFCYSRIRPGKLLDNDTRQSILSHISNNPGKHYSELKRELEISRGTLTHHLRKLEKEGLIRSKMVSKFKYFYPARRRELVPELTPAEREIAGLIGENPGCSIKVLSRRYGKKPRTVYHHVSNLHDLGVVDGNKDNGEFRWYLAAKDGAPELA